MNKFFILAGLVVLGACHKTPVAEAPVAHPPMNYISFNREMPFAQILSVDLDSNGVYDFLFYTNLAKNVAPGTTYHYFQFSGGYGSGAAVQLSATADFQTPVLAKNAAISDSLPTKPTWMNATGVMLTRRLVASPAAPWEGGWKDAHHQYLAVRVDRSGHHYYGWLEISFDAVAEKLLLHCGAICKEPDIEVKAGL